MKLKAGVRVNGIQPPIILALLAAEGVYRTVGVDLVVTAVTDGTHKPGSSHYTGCAIDLRSSTLTNPTAVAQAIQAALTEDYQVLVETDHLHIQYRPQQPF